MGVKTQLPRDILGAPIQILKLGETFTALMSGTTATTAAVAIDASVVRVVADQAFHMLFDSRTSVSAATTDPLFPANTPEYIQFPLTATLVHVLGTLTTATSLLYITEAV